MSLLQQNPSDEMDDAARGEELTKGSSHPLIAAAIAAVVVAAALGLYFVLGQKPPVAVGEVEQAWVHPQHTETSGFDAAGQPMPKEIWDQIYVFAQVKVTNQSTKPLFLHSGSVNATMPDGSIRSAYVATAHDYDRVFLAYPNMPVQHGASLNLESTVQPGQTVEGEVVAAFKMSKAEWDSRKDLGFNVGLQYNPDLKLTLHGAPVER